MADESEAATERAVVTTYVPRYQKELWQDHADDLGMSQSEFVKAMVQAGRRGFGTSEGPDGSGRASSERNPQGSDPEDTGPEELESTVLDALEDEPYLGWDDLVDVVIGDVEADLEETITDLQERNEITHSPRKGGYVRLEE
ncbi:MAG: DUF5805 domain-containing protein [Halanaeroarchaeum sp.]